MTLTEDSYSGVPLPFYREYGLENPDGKTLMEGQNYGEHQLFALRTRLEHDPLYADLSTREGTKITFRRYPSDIGMRVHLQISSVDVKSGDIYYLTPPWLEDRVKYWLDQHKDYFTLISDQYPIVLERHIPSWWLREIISKINVKALLREALIDEMGDDGRYLDLTPYDFFYEDGRLYIRLIDHNNKDNVGVWTSNEPLESGERAFKRLDVNYGDYKYFSSRYYQIYTRLIEHLENWYERGALVLEPTSHLIKDWRMMELQEHRGIYVTSWQDIRFTLYDGVTPMLSRQLISSRNNWDFQMIYYYIGNNPAALHDIVTVIPQLSIIYNNILMVRINNIDDAISYADAISDLSVTSYGKVKRSLTRKEGVPGYYDLLRGKIIYIERIKDIEFSLPSKITYSTPTLNIRELIGKLPKESMPKIPMRESSYVKI